VSKMENRNLQKKWLVCYCYGSQNEGVRKTVSKQTTSLKA
jgi:hypothetical protein